MKKSFLLVISMMFLCSCSSLSYQGKSATQKPIAFKNGDSIWKNDDLSVKYQCQHDQNRFQISGSVNLGSGIAHNFSTIDYFRLQIHITDAQGKILLSRLLADSGHLVKVEPWTFKQNFLLPAGAEAMIFSYSGRAVIAGDDLTTWDFWLNP